MTSEAELRAAYPGAADIVCIHEFHPDASIGTALMIAKAVVASMSPEKVVAILRESADDAIAETGKGAIKTHRHQLDHPDFTRYIAAKMGAV